MEHTILQMRDETRDEKVEVRDLRAATASFETERSDFRDRLSAAHEHRRALESQVAELEAKRQIRRSSDLIT